MKNKFSIQLTVRENWLQSIIVFIEKHMFMLLTILLSAISIASFIYYLQTGLGLQYNDARSHLDIGRRVVEGLKPGIAQLGSVWLPLPHLLMIPTIWNDWMWHSGLSGGLQSMISFVATGFLIYLFLKKLGVGLLGQIVGVGIWMTNLNVLYLQSTAMTELLLIATSLAGVYYLFLWQKDNRVINLVKSAFWILLATMNRYDGWFLLGWALVIVVFIAFRKKGIRAAEGLFFFFLTLGGIGIALWFLWNLLIFKDPLYFILGPYSAHAQQEQLVTAGVLATKKNIVLSVIVYYYALAFNTGFFTLLLAICGAILLFLDKRILPATRVVLSALFSPLIFNILALFLGFSVLFVQGISGNTWFNVRYGIMMAPSIAIFVGYLIHKVKPLRLVLIALLIFVTFFSFMNRDAVTIDDARVGASQKNVSQITDWLKVHAAHEKGFILISAASHDAIIFSSGLPMSRFIHEGTGEYWKSATTSPDRWARWIIMRTNDINDQTFRLIKKSGQLDKYNLIGHYPFADIYEIKPQYLKNLHYTPTLPGQK